MTQNSINSKQPLIQYVYTNSATQTNLSTAIPKDNTIPQITEGTEVINCAITPTSATNLLLIRANLTYFPGNTTDVQIALFKGGTNNALAAMEGIYLAGAYYAGQNEIFYTMVAGTTSAITFSVRMGNGSGVTLVVNAAQFGGVQNIFMEIMEIKA